MKRRHLLQLAASTLATLGVSTAVVQQQGLRYARALAQPTQRKRALLVGINQYTRPLRSLKGCVPDVNMQRELLLHRFGFSETDILTLTDQQATREAILDAFQDHLINACEAGDVAVFHFSGHGRRIADSAPVRVAGDERDPLSSTLVPYDADGNNGEVLDIMGKTLFLLTSKLRTENITVVLDSCYAEGGIRGNVRIRSGGNQRGLRPNDTELNYQEGLRQELGLSEAALQDLRDVSIAKGIALAAARRNQEAIDVTFGSPVSGESVDAGAFTYFLTQYLWHEAEPVRQVMANVSRNLADNTFSQTPSACVAPFNCSSDNPGDTPTPTYFVEPTETDRIPSAEGVILSTSGQRGTVWLGGSDPHSLVTYGTGATFVAIAPDGTPQPEQICVLRRRGLMAEVALSSSATLPKGTLLQESSRVIPADLKLRIGLDPSVMNELDTIQQTFGTLNRRIELVPYQSETTPYPGEVQYILSRMTANYRNRFQQREQVELPQANSLVLFSQGLDEIIPGSGGTSNETIADASALQSGSVADRLSTKFNALLSARLIKLLVNANSSRLNIQAEIQVLGGRSQLAQFFTARGSQTPQTTPGNLLEIPIGRSIQFVVTHQEPSPMHMLVFVVDRTGDILPVFPRRFLGVTAADTLIPPNQPKQIPDPTNDPPLDAEEAGFGEALIIASRSPLDQAIRALRSDRTATVPVVEALLGDLSGVEVGRRSASHSGFHITAADMATLSIPFRVV